LNRKRFLEFIEFEWLGFLTHLVRSAILCADRCLANQSFKKMILSFEQGSGLSGSMVEEVETPELFPWGIILAFVNMWINSILMNYSGWSGCMGGKSFVSTKERRGID
jgi:hypothetical protein